MKFLLKKHAQLAPLYKFLLNGVVLLFLWFVFYQFLRYNTIINQIYETLTEQLTIYLLHASKLVLNVFGFDCEISGKTIRIVGTGGVYLNRGCLGRNLMGLFVGFILAYPGKIIHKFWYIPVGILVINFINVLRIAGLTYIVLEFPEYLDINHHIIFKYTVYFFIFMMWYFWIKKFSVPVGKLPDKKEKPKPGLINAQD